MPVAIFETGYQPIGIAAGPAGTPAAGKLFVANFLGVDRDGLGYASDEVSALHFDRSFPALWR